MGKSIKKYKGGGIVPKVVRKEIVKLISIKDREGNEYDEANRRSKFIGGQGLVVFCESLHKLPGEIFSIFYYSHDLEPDTMTFDSVTTGYGEIIRDEKSGIVFRTKNSFYHYDFETITLSDNLKKALLEYGESLEQKYEIREMKKLR